MENIMTMRLFLSRVLFPFLVVPLFAVPFCAQAGEVAILVAPETGGFVVDESAIFRVFVSSDGQLVNAIEAQLSYDPKMVAVTSVDKEGSLVSSWTEEPLIDETLGLVSFGGMLATSTALDRGLVLVLHIRPLRTGEFALHFEQGAAVHAADGTGGNTLTGFRDGRYRVTPKDLSMEATDETHLGEVLGVATDTPPVTLVTITSATHPDQEAWYSATSSKFLFHAEEGVTAIRLGFDTNAHGLARVRYAPPISAKTIDNIDDGIWYLHLVAEVPGVADFTTDYVVRIDHTPPDQFTVNEVPRNNTADPNVRFTVDATDTLSGIAHYLMGIDGEAPVRFVSDGLQPFEAHAFSPGVHVLHASAVDKAGNTLSIDRSFEVTHLPSPRLTLHDKAQREREPLRLLIQGPKDATFAVSFSRSGAAPIIEKVVADGSGAANFVSKATLIPGIYEVWASATDATGGISKESERISFSVSASLFGVMTRHPFVPVALLAFIALVLFSMRLLKKKHQKQPLMRHAATPKTTSPTSTNSTTSAPKPTTSRGRIVLQPRVQTPKHPPLRLG